MDRVVGVSQCIKRACSDFRGFIRDDCCGLGIIVSQGRDALAFVP